MNDYKVTYNAINKIANEVETQNSEKASELQKLEINDDALVTAQYSSLAAFLEVAGWTEAQFLDLRKGKILALQASQKFYSIGYLYNFKRISQIEDAEDGAVFFISGMYQSEFDGGDQFVVQFDPGGGESSVVTYYYEN